METQAKMKGDSLARGIGMGIIASVVGTLMMDLVMIVQLLIMGEPALAYLDLIGSVFGGGVPLGTLVHIITTVVLGIGFGLPVLTVDALRINSARKGRTLGIVTGAASISACVPFAILADEAIARVLTFMTFPHLVWGVGVGLVAGYGMVAAATSDA